MSPNSQLTITNDDSELFKDPAEYRRLIGKLNYHIVTHPDNTYFVSIVSPFMFSSTVNHWAVLD